MYVKMIQISLLFKLIGYNINQIKEIMLLVNSLVNHN